MPARVSGTAPVEFLAQPLQGLARVVSDVSILGVGKAVEVRPEQSQSLQGDELNRLMNPLRVLAGERLAEPVQGLTLAQPRQGSAGALANFRVGVAASIGQR